MNSPKPFLLGLVGVLIVAGPTLAGPFTAGDLVVVTIGDGTTALSSSAAPVNLREYNPTTMALVQAIAMPTVASGSNLAFTDSGSATSDGALTLSPNGQFLALAGYNAPVGTASVVSTTTDQVSRVVGIVNAAGVVDTSTRITDGYSGNNIRGAVTTNGQTIYTSGTSGSTGGTRETTVGGTGSSTQISTTVTNTRVVNIFNGQLYTSSGSGSNIGINAVGAGIPTTGGQTTTLITSGTPTADVNPYGFVFLKNDLFVVDSSAGLLKYTLSTATGLYSYVGTLSTISGLTGLTGSVAANGDEILYATNPTNLYGFDVTPAGGITTQTLATASANTTFRGVAFAPTAAVGAVPEPGSVVLLGLGALGVAAALRRKARMA